MKKQRDLKEIEDLIVQNRPFLDREFKVKNIGIFGKAAKPESGPGITEGIKTQDRSTYSK